MTNDEGRLPLGIDVPPLKPQETLAVSGTAIIGGYVQDNEKSADLRGTEKYRSYNDMVANTSIVAAGVRTLLNLAGNAQWRVEPAEDSGEEGQEIADKVYDILHTMRRPWNRIVRRLASAKFYGFAVGEWTAKRLDDGTIGFKDIISIPQSTIERWITEPDGNVTGIIQTSPQTGKDVPIPREKLVYVVEDSLNDSPEGMGLLRHIADSVRRLKRLQELELWGYSNNLRGVPIARAPLAELAARVNSQQITRADADTALRGITSFCSYQTRTPDMGLLLDSAVYKGSGDQRTPSGNLQWDIELLEGGKYELKEVAEAIIRIQREIARVLGVEHLLLGENSSSSRNLSQDKTRSFGLLVDSILLSIQEAMQADLLRPLFVLNGWDMALMPTLKTEAQAFRDPAEMSATIRDLATAGVQIDRQDEVVGEIYDLMGLTRLAKLSDIDPDLLLIPDKEQESEPTPTIETQNGDNLDDNDRID